MRNPDFQITEVSKPTFSDVILDRRGFFSALGALTVASVADAQGEAPKGIQFGTRGKYATNRNLLYPGTHPITLQAVITPKDVSGEMTIIGNHHSSGVALRIKGGFYECTVHNGTQYETVFSDAPAKEGERVTVTGIYDGRMLRLYINHTLQKSLLQCSGKHKASRHPLYIGADPNERGQAQHELNGTIESIRVSGCARDKDPKWRKDPQCDPDKFDVLYLGSEMTDEGLWKDQSKYGNHAEIIGKRDE